MEIVNKLDFTDNAVNRYNNKPSLLFFSKENRDRAYKLLKAEGINCRRSRVLNQQLHPEYIEDFKGEIETGLGNCMYQMFWAKLWSIERPYGGN